MSMVCGMGARRTICFSVIAAMLIGFSGCDDRPQNAPVQSNANSSRSEPLRVVASVYVLGDIVRQIGGRYVHVDGVLESPRGLAGFEPSQDGQERIRAGDLVVPGGAPEPWAVRES